MAQVLRKAIQESPVVVVTGARQVGKSTLLKNEDPFKKWRYISLDDFDLLKQAEENPASLWAGARKIILDEVQKAPRLLNAVKKAVDEKGSEIKFILSGSANLLLMHQVSESLAGRALYLNLLPITLGEEYEKPIPNILLKLLDGQFPKEGAIAPHDPAFFCLRGFMPPLLKLKKTASFMRWWEGYIVTYLERDLRQLSQVESLPDFQRVMRALALRTGQILNQTAASRDTAVSQPTVYRYINLLETTCLIERLPVFALNRTKRLIKAPKVFWFDPALATYLSGIHDSETWRASREAGGLFECLVLFHLKALTQLATPKPHIYYWRTTTGNEVDFVIEQGRKLIALEVKLTAKPLYSDIENLRLFLKEYPETKAAVLVYSGNEIRHMDEKIVALPWTCLTGAA